MKVQVPGTVLMGVPETVVEIDGERVEWNGKTLGYVWLGSHSYSQPVRRGSRVALYHRQVKEWKGSYEPRGGGYGRPRFWSDTRRGVIQQMIAQREDQ